MSENETKAGETLEEGVAPGETPPAETALGTSTGTEFKFANVVARIGQQDKDEIFSFLMSSIHQKLPPETTLYLFAEKIQIAVDKLK